MTGLWLAGSCMAALAGCALPAVHRVIEACVTELQDHYIVTPHPNHPMNGCWSPWESPSSNEGMFYGFWAGEILRGLSLYVTYRRSVS